METSDAQIFAQKKSRAKKRDVLLLWIMVGGEEGGEQIHLIIFLGLYRGIGFGGKHASSVNGKTIFLKKETHFYARSLVATLFTTLDLPLKHTATVRTPLFIRHT